MTPRVVVVGCGFGGLWAAQGLRRAPVDVTVIDRTNHHLFSPLLYQVATAGLSAPSVAAPIRHILAKQRNATVLLGEAKSIEPQKKEVVLEDDSRMPYDYLIVATGSTHSYFGHDDWEPFAPGLKTLEDALEIRRRVLYAFERAERENDPVRRAAWLTFVVIGAGATGVELAGTFAEIARHTLRGEFRRIDPHRARVVLVEGTERLSAQAAGWAAGVAASPLGAALGAPRDRAGRVQVAPDLSVPGHAEVFVVGDLAAIEGVPGIAPAAKQMGAHSAANVKRMLAG